MNSTGAFNMKSTSPLHLATENLEIIRFLVSKGADVNAKTNDATSPLHNALYDKKLETVRFLISKSANVNTKNKQGKK